MGEFCYCQEINIAFYRVSFYFCFSLYIIWICDHRFLILPLNFNVRVQYQSIFEAKALSIFFSFMGLLICLNNSSLFKWLSVRVGNAKSPEQLRNQWVLDHGGCMQIQVDKWMCIHLQGSLFCVSTTSKIFLPSENLLLKVPSVFIIKTWPF